MARTTRIGIIREAIKAEGGTPPMKTGVDYYADGPYSDCASALQRRANESIYKVPKDDNDLPLAARKRVVDALRNHPDVKTAYLSRKYTSYGRNSGNHLKVVFQN